MKIQSTPLTFIDQTDSRKLEVYIKSNSPTVQIFNGNSGVYTPNWTEGEKLVLSIDVFLDSRAMTTTEYNGTVIKWYKDDIEMSDGVIEDISADKRKITIKDNILKDSPIITYICEATYQGIVASARITFTRVDTGLNGNDGADGTSVNIKATASSVAPITGTDYYTIKYNGSNISTAELNDAYMYNGDLYVCVDSRNGVDYFINVGRIQGPAGEPAKNIVLSGSAQVFKISKTNAYTPTAISVTAHTFNTSTINWTYSTNGGQTFLSTVPTGVSRNGNIVTITGSTLASNSIVVKASDGAVEDIFTIYKAFDGTDGSDGDKGDPAPLAFLTNENISFAANENGQVPLVTFTTNVVSYKGTTKVTPTVRVKADGTPDITDLPAGMTASAPINSSNEQILTFSIANNSTLGSASSNSGTITIPVTSPVSTNLKLSWSKINTGHTGVGIKSTTVTYGVSDSSTAQPTEWQSAIPTVAEGKYLWTRTIIDYTDESKPDTVTYIYAKQGTKGDTGNPGNSVTVSSIQYQEGTSATTAPTGTWSNAVVAVADGRYLWSKTAFSDGKIAYGVAKQGEKGGTGDAGRGISSIVEQYYHSTSATSQAGGSWTATAPTWVDGKYIWTRSVITYTDTTTHTTTPICVTGQRGGTGGTGAPGTGVESVDIWYYQSTSATALSGGSWSTTAPTWSDGKYVWTKTITTYTDKTTDETSAVCLTGQRGATGVGIKSVAEKYLATASSSGVTISTEGWTDTVQTITSANKYLWNYEIITYTNNTTTTTNPIIIGVFGNTGGTGAPGKGIKSITEYYLATASASGVATSTSGWTTTMQSITSVKKYLWNYELITYTDNTTSTVAPVIIGAYGDKGETGVGIKSVSERYLATSSNSGVTTSTSGWTEAVQSMTATNKYLWNYEILTYTNNTTSTTPPIIIGVYGDKGNTGNTGKGVKSVTEYYLASSLSTGVTVSTTGWQLTMQPLSETNKYLWNYELITYTDNTTSTIAPVIIGVYGDRGAQGAPGDDAVTFQVYSNNGYALSTGIPSILLQTFAYFGDVEIKADATFQWYRHNGTDWVAISGATNAYFNVSRDDVVFSNNYMCKMIFNSTEYVGVVTIEDKNDENKVFASKPSNYFAGDLWIVGTDYAPSGFTVGTMLRAEHTNSTYADSDWVAATKYDEEISDLKDTVDSYKQYFSIDSTNGLKVGDASINNNTLTVDRIETTTINAKEIEVESPLTVTGKYSGSTMQQAPIINIGNFSIVVESNGSLSFVANT